jgi:signal transduction histidine kinase
MAVIDIADTGPGIAPDALRRIFDPFFTTKPVGEGTGLGLSISSEIVTKHGGEIRAQSPPAGGTVFTLRLPVVRAGAPGRATVG